MIIFYHSKESEELFRKKIMPTIDLFMFDKSIEICMRDEFKADVEEFRCNLNDKLTRLELGKDEIVEVRF